MHPSTSRLVAFVAAWALVAGAGSSEAVRSGPPCAACIIVDDTGRVLFARNAGEPRANASTTKIVTALVVRERTELEDTVVVSAAAASEGGGGLDLSPGDRYTVHALLHALLLTSSNEAAVALAEHVAGSHEAFVAIMNRTADALGATATRFVTAHGLDVSGHYSSARDLARFGLELLADDELARIVGTRTTTIAGPAGGEVLENRNLLLETYPGATGIKTGYTAEAGDVLVASARRDGRSIVAVTMGAPGSQAAAAEAATLLERGWRILARSVLVRRGTAVGTLVFDPGGATEVVTAEPIRGSARPEEIEVSFDADPDVAAPIAAGQVVGEVTVAVDDRVLYRAPAHARHAIAAADPSWGEVAISALLRAVASLVEEVAP